MTIKSVVSTTTEVALLSSQFKQQQSVDNKSYPTNNQQSSSTASLQNSGVTDIVSVKNAQEFLKKSNSEIAKPDILKQENQLLTKSEQEAKSKQEDLNKATADSENLATKGSVVFEYDALSRASIVKFLDMKGNVISQVPPEQYLKTLQMRGSSPEDEKGTLVNKKV